MNAKSSILWGEARIPFRWSSSSPRWRLTVEKTRLFWIGIYNRGEDVSPDDITVEGWNDDAEFWMYGAILFCISKGIR